MLIYFIFIYIHTYILRETFKTNCEYYNIQRSVDWKVVFRVKEFLMRKHDGFER